MGDIYRATDTVLGRDVAIKVLADRYSAGRARCASASRGRLSRRRVSRASPTWSRSSTSASTPAAPTSSWSTSAAVRSTRLGKDGPPPPERTFTWLGAGGTRTRRRTPGGGHPSRRQAREPHARPRGQRSRRRLRNRERDRARLADDDGDRARHGRVPLARAGAGRARDAGERPVWIAVVAFELLTGSRPFAAESPTAEAAAHVNAPVPSVSERQVCRVSSTRFSSGRWRRTRADGTRRAPSSSRHCAPRSRTRPARRASCRGPSPPPHERPQLRSSVGRLSRGAPGRCSRAALLGALAGALLAYFLTRDDGANAAAPTTVVTGPDGDDQGQTRLSRRPVTVTTSPPPRRPRRRLGASGDGAEQRGLYEDAGRRLRGRTARCSSRRCRSSQGRARSTEAYASYNLAYTRFQLGNCDGVLELLDRSESIQGQRDEIDRLRTGAEDAAASPAERRTACRSTRGNRPSA